MHKHTPLKEAFIISPTNTESRMILLSAIFGKAGILTAQVAEHDMTFSSGFSYIFLHRDIETTALQTYLGSAKPRRVQHADTDNVFFNIKVLQPQSMIKDAAVKSPGINFLLLWYPEDGNLCM